MRRAGHAAEQVEPLLAALAAEGLLSDERFCEVYVRSRMESGHGPQGIRQELAQRGVEETLIGAALEAAGVDWVACAVAVRRKRFGEPLPRDYREWSRQARFLQYRGFSAEQIRSALGDGE